MRGKIIGVIAGCIAAGLLAGCTSGTSSQSTPTPSSSISGVNPNVPDPYALLPQVPSFTLTSEDVKAGQQMPAAQLSAQSISPQLSWSGFPPNTKSFVVTMYDPAAPTGSGWWHWAVANIPATTTSLPTNAGAPDSKTLPAGSFQLKNDYNQEQFMGAGPLPGTGVHPYYITVSALDVETVDIPKTATPALLGVTINPHTLARASLVPTAVAP